METVTAPVRPSKKETSAILAPQKVVGEKSRRRYAASRKVNLKTPREPRYKFYKVFENETSVIEILADDFIPFQSALVKIKAACACHSKQHPAFSLPTGGPAFHEFVSRIRAMEFAKAGALKFIDQLIADGEKSNNLLLKYREDHYDDLNVNLTDRNIRKLEWELKEG